MTRHPYRIARQEHLGDMLDTLAEDASLRWKWDYDNAKRRAIFNIKLPNRSWQALDTKKAEYVVQAECNELGIRWRPVPHPGGESQRKIITQWMNSG